MSAFVTLICAGKKNDAFYGELSGSYNNLYFIDWLSHKHQCFIGGHTALC